MKTVYWAVIWADDKTSAIKNPECLRIAWRKYSDPRDACKDCWGLVTKNMWVKNLGGNATPLKSYAKRSNMLNPQSEGWKHVTEYSTS